ncbi:Major intrinsic multiple antibiotic resistance efflux outer membrane protein OprM precursor [Perkinsela sp. CCAP 1560/4]|nr:Major intrinsic multiple antibiotic resistance efflux outer membrane protein OprM precursor [Perkinsela sp. CCAP 1560/4]|eukprot:KNH07753.1 Major intrinsic multiple antibiotic resistance efflux outer membrane protein OprM precursor [Perkinsela sp. CCAP 1560/4]
MLGIGVLFTKHLTQKRKQWKEGIVVYTPPNILHLRECVDAERILDKGEVSMIDLKRCASDIIATAYHKLGKDDTLGSSVPETLFDGYLIDPQQPECPTDKVHARPPLNGPLPLAKPTHCVSTVESNAHLPIVSKRPEEDSVHKRSEMIARCKNTIAEGRKRWKSCQTFDEEPTDLPQREPKILQRESQMRTANTTINAELVHERRKHDEALYQHLSHLVAKDKATQAEINALFDCGNWHVPIFGNTPRRRDATHLVNSIFPSGNGGQ